MSPEGRHATRRAVCRPHYTTDIHRHKHRKRYCPHLCTTRLLYLHNAPTSMRSSTPSVGIGRIHPPPAARDAPGQARNACSSGCSRSGVPVASMWGLEEFTRIWHPSGCLLSLSCDLSRSALCKQPRSESAYLSPACAMQQGSSAVPTSITSQIPLHALTPQGSACITCGPGPWVACSAAPTLQGAVSRNLWAQPWVATQHPQPGTQHQPPPRRHGCRASGRMSPASSIGPRSERCGDFCSANQAP